MSYTTRDQSVEDANPVLLFQFAQGSTTYRYALASESVALSVEGHTWEPAVMVPSEFVHANDVGRDELTIELAADGALAQTFSTGTPDVMTTLTVKRTFTTIGSQPEETPVLYWKGHVASSGLAPGKVILKCDPVFTRLQRPGLRALCTKMCRHVLFGRGCNVNADSYKTTVAIRQSSGAVITLPSPDSYGYWDGGTLKAPDGTVRMIVKHTGGKLYLIRAIASLNAAVLADPVNGAIVYLYRGCDHTFAMCKARFNNAGNFGGDPNFAQKNPFTTQVSFV